MNIEIKLIRNDVVALAKIQHLVPMARKARVPIKETKTPVEYWIAEADGKVVGFQGASLLDPRTARLKTTFVHPDFRGHGIFDKLFYACLTDLEKRGVYTFSGFFTPMSISTGLRYGFKVKSTKEGSDIVYATKELK